MRYKFAPCYQKEITFKKYLLTDIVEAGYFLVPKNLIEHHRFPLNGSLKYAFLS